MRKIVVYCACDRLNYGDLLFPLIIKNIFNVKYNQEVEIVGTIKSNLSEYGALKTDSYKVLWKKRKIDDKDFLIIAGGEVLQTEWSAVLSFLSSIYYHVYHRSPFKKLFNKFAQILIGNSNESLPFVPSSFKILNDYYLIFNAVGGNFVSSSIHSKTIEKSLENSVYSSFRNKHIYNDIKLNFSNVNAILSPDSALIMSDVFKEIPTESSTKYIVFQVGYYKSIRKLEIIAQQLDSLQKITKLEIVLMPIGFCAGHDDLKALRIIKGRLNNPNITIRSEKNIFSLMKSIACSKLFIGTSLHGVITAMSFNVPYLGLNPKIEKLESYLDTWGIAGLNKCSEYDSLAKNAVKALEMDRKILKEHFDKQKNMVYSSFDDIIQIINSK
jgi:polysaccharide pyruvyl transferase WcaK-like protein